jgi:uncharacterized protein YecE (DUF72 family)
LDLLANFIKFLPKKKTSFFEFRHKSWYEDDTFELMRQLDVGFCIHDMPDRESPRVVTGNVIYVRFHGTTGRYAGNYTKSLLQNWAKWLKGEAPNVRAIYAYFNNDIGGHAIKNAKQLREQLLPNKVSV